MTDYNAGFAEAFCERQDLLYRVAILDHIRSTWARRHDGREPEPDAVEDERFKIVIAEDKIDPFGLR